MNARVRLLLIGLAVGISLAAILWAGRSAVAPREEPLYQGKTLSYWVTRVGRIEEFDGAPQDAVAAIRERRVDKRIANWVDSICVEVDQRG